MLDENGECGEFSFSSNVCIQNLLEVSSQTKEVNGTKINMGFPLIQVFLDIVVNCLNLIDQKAFDPKSRLQKSCLSYWNNK